MRVKEGRNVFDLLSGTALKPIITWFDGDGNRETREGAQMEVSSQRA